MGRLKELRAYVDGELEALDNPSKRNGAIVPTGFLWRQR